MTSTRERQQRAAARARLAREMAERQAAARRRRQRQAAIGAAAALVVIVGAVVWVMAAVGDDEEPSLAAEPSPSPSVAAGLCPWAPDDVASNPYLTDVGMPPEVTEPLSGTRTMTITTDHGVITVELDAAAAPCATASFTYLAEQEFYDGSPCHRLTTDDESTPEDDLFVLQCGDPTGTGFGGPTYRYPEENIPPSEVDNFPRGTVAMANTGQPASTGSQFFIVYEDSTLRPPNYTVVGQVTEGMEIIDEIAAAGAVNPDGETVADGRPATSITIETLRVSDPTA